LAFPARNAVQLWNLVNMTLEFAVHSRRWIALGSAKSICLSRRISLA